MCRHQKQGLTFMLNREKGWDLHGSRTDVWRSYMDLNSTLRYIWPVPPVITWLLCCCSDPLRYQNTLSRHSQLEPPPDFKGGCLADCMGLGKTLSMLSLIAANPFSARALKFCGGDSYQALTKRIKATLIVVPFSCKTCHNVVSAMALC